jgi:hypothetical protein
MSTELILLHVVFIASCVYFSWASGVKFGRGQMFEDLLEEDLLDLNKTKDFIGKIAEQEAIKKKIK